MSSEPLPLLSRYAPSDDICARKHGGSETSEAAHESIRESKERLCRRILAYLEDAGRYGATWFEISESLGIAYANSGRISEMKADGRVVENGEKRATRSGREAFVVVARRFA